MLASSFASGFGLSAALIVAIGAQNVFVLRQGLRREHVGVVVLFCAAADLALMALGVAGVGALLGAVPGLLAVLTLGGAAFLAAYGVAALRRALAPGRLLAGAVPDPVPLARTLRAAAAFTLLNPHVYLDTVLLVGAVGQGAASRPGFLAGAGSASALWFAGLGFGARLLAPVFAKRAAWRVLDAVVALTMLALAAMLLVRALHLPP